MDGRGDETYTLEAGQQCVLTKARESEERGWSPEGEGRKSLFSSSSGAFQYIVSANHRRATPWRYRHVKAKAGTRTMLTLLYALPPLSLQEGGVGWHLMCQDEEAVAAGIVDGTRVGKIPVVLHSNELLWGLLAVSHRKTNTVPS